jgi:hypothetical protein
LIFEGEERTSGKPDIMKSLQRHCKALNGKMPL